MNEHSPMHGLGGERARLSHDQDGIALSGMLTATVRGQLSADETWQDLDLDSRTFSRLSPARLLELLSNLSPEVSRELWNFLRMCNPGYEITAMNPNGKTKAPATRQAVLDGIVARLKHLYGAFDVVVARLFLGGFLRGALFAELVIGSDGRTTVDLATPDPASARWRIVTDPERGKVYQLGQWQNGQFVPLDVETVRYVPIDPLPAHPEGRAPAAPALFPAIFLLAMLHDIRRVVQQQGWPRIDVEIVLEKLAAAMPAGARSDPKVFMTWVNTVTDEVKREYEKLQPDDAYIHTDVAKVNRPVGAVDSSSLGAVDGLISVLERMLVRALKTMPLLMGITDSVSEANANRQWEMYVAGIKAIQHLCEQLLEHLFTLALEAQGIPAVAQVRFAELRAAEMLRDAQTEAQKIKNEREKYAAGWTDQKEASQAITGHDPAEDEPRNGAGAAPVEEQNPDPGAMK